MTEPLFTLRDLARELHLPESTVRFYRNSFAAFLPAVGDGRRRRYSPEALGLLRFVAESFAQNRRREDIVAVLSEMTGIESAEVAPPAPPARPALMRALPAVTRPAPPAPSDEMVSTLLDGERDRREVMWQIAREIVRLGEAVERQHHILEGMSRRLDQQTGHLLPAGVEATRPVASPPLAPLNNTSQELATELERLKDELKQERELVERLRRAKLQIERRATEAESRTGGG
jgi:DNA-binding transcriptional MerR regulator